MVASLVWALACSGPSFQPSDCEDDECAGASSGGRATGGASRGGTGGAGEGGEPSGGTDTGGSSRGGSNEGGTDTGGTNNGGTDAGGTDAGGTNGGGSGTSGSAGTSSAGFPTTPVLDQFNRSALEVGENWIGATEAYQVLDRTLQCPEYYCSGVFWYLAFDVAQEVFATLVSFSEYSREINLVLKAQGNTDCDLMEVFYAPESEQVHVEACWDAQWNSFGSADVRLEPGDQLGGRVRPDGFVEVFKNGELLHTVDANDYPFIGSDGYIGVNGIVGDGAEPNVYDDFGGGSLDP